MKRILYLLCICICIYILPCGCTNRVAEPQQDKIMLTVAVPASDKEIISKYLNKYKYQSDIDFKIIDVSGDSEDIHRFYVSTCIDNKFNVDMYLMEDKWIKEFAECSYIDEVDLSQYEFIPIVQESVAYMDKTYAMPLYADVYAEFTKRSSTSDSLLYIEDGTEDYLAGVYSVLSNSSNLEAAIVKYDEELRSNNPNDFLFGNYGKARGWLNQYNIMKEQHAVEASDISISIDEKALLKTKAFAIRKGTKYKKEALEVLKFFLEDITQKSLMTDKTAISVLESFYEREDLYDITPHLLQIDGMNFTRIKADEHYTSDIKALSVIISKPEGDIQNKIAVIGKLIGR